MHWADVYEDVLPNRPQMAKNGPVSSTVAKVDKVPAPAADDPKEAKKPETPGAYLQRRIAEMKAAYPNFNFLEARQGLIEGGVVQDIPSATMTMEQAKQLADAVNDVYAAKGPKVG